VNLQQLRDAIRTQLDMDDEELPNQLLDGYLQEGYSRTIAMENRWPFFEASWPVASIGDTFIDLPSDCNVQQIVTLIDGVTGIRLMQIAPELAEDNFVNQSAATQPIYYTIWGSQITLWPHYAGDPRSFTLRGYRLEHDWIADGASAEVDADIRLHQLLVHYAIGLAYAQQEDEVLEDVYMKRWQQSYLAVHNAICAPRHHRPLILNGGMPYVPGYQPVQWNLPT
jgi:hypothetical protein